MDATILVNRTHRLPRKAIPQTLVEPEIIFDAPVGDRKRLLAVSAAKGVEALFARGKEEGIYLCGVSGYRSYERQEELYQKKRREQPKGRVPRSAQNSVYLPEEAEALPDLSSRKQKVYLEKWTFILHCI